MSSQNSLRGIPVTTVAAKQISPPNNALHWRRRAVQFGTLLIAVLIPLTGLLRIDVVAGAFLILDRQIWWSDDGFTR